MTEEKICTYCGNNEEQCHKQFGDNSSIHAFDTTGKLFCHLTCFQKFYEENNLNNQCQSHEQLTTQDILRINEQENSFIKNLPEDLERQLKIISERIITLQRLQESIRQSEIILKKHVMKINGQQESIKTERYRKAGVNSDLELKDKKLNKMQTMIQRYKKMNMSLEIVINIMTTISKFTRDEITKEWESL